MGVSDSVKKALLEYRDDILALDAFLLPEEPPLSLHQEIIFREFHSHRVRWLEALRGGAKSYTIARYDVLDGILNPRKKFIYSGPSYRQSKHPFRYARGMILDSPWLASELAKDPTENTERSEIVLKNGTKYIALPASGSKIHGERGTDLVLTEFFEYQKELYLRSVKPMLAVRGHPTRPNTVTFDTTAGWEFQFSFEIRKQILAQIAAGNPDYCFLAFDLDDMEAEGFPMDLELIAQDRGADEDIYQQQYFNRWLTVAGTFYELALLKREEIKRGEILTSARAGKAYGAGLDVARSLGGNGDDCAFAVWEGDPLVARSPLLVFAKKWNDITAGALARQIAPLLGAFNVSRLVMDFRGGGVAVYDKLVEEHGFVELDDPRPGRHIIEQFKSTPAIINEAHNRLRAAFQREEDQTEIREPSVMMPARPEDDLLVETYDTIDLGLKQLADLRTEMLPSGYYKFEQPSGKKKDVAYGILYGHHAIKQLMMTPAKVRRETGSPVVVSDLSRVLLVGDQSIGT